MSTTPPPPVSDGMRHEARALAGQWLYVLDPLVDPDGQVPGDAVVGAWPVDDRGGIVEDQWQPNPRYAPRTLGDDDLVAHLGRLRTDELTAHDLRVIGHGEVTVTADAAGDLTTVHDDRPGPAVEAWVRDDDARTAHPDVRPRRTTVAALAADLPTRHGVEFVLPDGRRIGVTADGVDRLAGGG